MTSCGSGNLPLTVVNPCGLPVTTTVTNNEGLVMITVDTPSGEVGSLNFETTSSGINVTTIASQDVFYRIISPTSITVQFVGTQSRLLFRFSPSFNSVEVDSVTIPQCTAYASFPGRIDADNLCNVTSLSFAFSAAIDNTILVNVGTAEILTATVFNNPNEPSRILSVGYISGGGSGVIAAPDPTNPLGIQVVLRDVTTDTFNVNSYLLISFTNKFTDVMVETAPSDRCTVYGFLTIPVLLAGCYNHPGIRVVIQKLSDVEYSITVLDNNQVFAIVHFRYDASSITPIQSVTSSTKGLVPMTNNVDTITLSWFA